MSILLDQVIIEEVSQYCPQEFLLYHKCVQETPLEKRQDCFKKQKALMHCVDTSVPSYLKIKKQCTEHMLKYEQCIVNNPDYRIKCISHLNDLRDCSAKALDVNNRDII